MRMGHRQNFDGGFLGPRVALPKTPRVAERIPLRPWLRMGYRQFFDRCFEVVGTFGFGVPAPKVNAKVWGVGVSGFAKILVFKLRSVPLVGETSIFAESAD